MEDGINFQIGYFETFVIVIKLTEICIYKIKKQYSFCGNIQKGWRLL
ncbi:hypothetical protein BCE_2530 [Bacillus cereus ATCC 10987]|jgi:hypothetical protein|uniref:Uncharacterized protein n=1 Tax=Bacillus cereus (strain ATCC 10987 / NRS 248) TaxID=222523 RepID=Q737W6_BACC1|nr:hypothetical protein BCE_2530 [Bacillus cereus ATCC 10987]